MTEQASLSGPLAKLGRAHHHLKALYDEFNLSVGHQTHALTREDGDEPRTYIFKACDLPELPPDWGLIVGDFAQNLRSSLDHLVWQLVILSEAEPGGDNQFPICSSGARYWCAKKNGAPGMRDGYLRGVAEQYRTPIDEVQPYRGGTSPQDTFLAGLGDLSNFDKHRVVQVAFRAVLEPIEDHFEVFSTDERAYVQVTSTPWKRLENDAEVFQVKIITDDPNAGVQMKADLPVAIGFGETGIRIESLGPLYEFVRDFIKSYTRAFGE